MTEIESEELSRKIELGIKASVVDAIEEHRRMRRSIVIWRDGKVVTIPASEIPPREDRESMDSETGGV